ncbi:MAG TPA: acetolactate decarboxylase [Methanoregulaceae archaeon]|nr:acetolactate decarboxylase [Methanoregulaceae archaeon]
MDKKFFLGIAVAVAIVFFAAAFAGHYVKSTAPAAPSEGRETLYQVSTIDALMLGVYEGVEPFSGLERHGDFGIGTFDALDGEMIALDGVYYQAKSDGTVAIVPGSATTPFATVTFYEQDVEATAGSAMNYSEFSTYLSDRLPSENMVYAVRMHGTFPVMKVRSVPRQSPPYLPLTAAVANQTVFDYRNATGTVVGFSLPQFFSGLNVPGYHLHFISDDRTAGGHILDMTVPAGMDAGLDITPEFDMVLPTSGPFTGADLTKDMSADLEKVER